MSTLQTTFIQKLGAGTDAFEIPANDGTSGQYLQTDGTGGLSWQTVASLSNAEDGAGTDFEFNSGYGSNATAYGCRAWVKFNGTGTVAINGDGGVTSVSDNATGVYTINFDFTMPDTNYSVVGTTLTRVGDYGGFFSIRANSSGVPDSYTTTGVRIQTSESTSGALADSQIVCAAIFR